MSLWCRLLIFCLFIISGNFAFLLVPEELPSILSIFYSNVPPVRKGTDSRIGLGFRLGPNADFQVQFELGPQTNTQPIGPNAGMNDSMPSSSKKRHTNPTTLHSKYNSTSPERWIQSWKFNIENEINTENDVEHPIKVAVDPTMEKNEFVNHLRQLYQNANNNVTTET